MEGNGKGGKVREVKAEGGGRGGGGEEISRAVLDGFHVWRS